MIINIMKHRDEYALLESWLKERGLKMTSTRKTVLDAFLATEGHITAESLLAAARRLDSGIGQATVFRTVRLLTEAGLAREACQDDGPRTYEHSYRHDHHDHLRCVRCGAIVEFFDPGIERAQEAVFARHGFVPTSHRMELLGLCPACAAKEASAASEASIARERLS